MGELIETPHELSVLLNCSSYQGMTDEEIEKIITYKENMAAKNAVLEAETERHAQLMDMLKTQQQQACDAAAQSLKNALDMQIKYSRVTGNE